MPTHLQRPPPTAHSLRLQAKGYPIWTRKGDTNAFFTLFFDSLVTQLGMVRKSGTGGVLSRPRCAVPKLPSRRPTRIQQMSNAYVVGFTPAFVYKHFMGGLTVSLFVGNVYYALQASKVAMKT